jgi:membrane protease YdiL (CAAX protease family)
MTSNLSAWAGKAPLAGYFLLAYGISWAIGIPLAITARWNQQPLPFSIHYLIAYGPMLSALIMTWLTDGLDGLKELLARILKWRVQPVWWLVAFSPLGLFAVFAIMKRFIQGEWMDFGLLGQVNFLPNLGLGALFLWIFTFGLGEEIGWRGYALPRLQKNRSSLSATLILSAFWAIWHLPQFFYLFDVTILLGWLFGLLAGAIVFTWLYNSTQGSILMVALWHGTFNFITASKAGEGVIAAVLSTLVIVWSVFIIVLFKPANLSHLEKQDV